MIIILIILIIIIIIIIIIKKNKTYNCRDRDQCVEVIAESIEVALLDELDVARIRRPPRVVDVRARTT